MTLDVVNMCVWDADLSHILGKNVKLHKFKTEHMNRSIGVERGYDPGSNQRAVYLSEDKKQAWVKSDNIRFVDNKSICRAGKMLLDVQDRMGSVFFCMKLFKQIEKM